MFLSILTSSIVLLSCIFCESARILGVVPIPSYSHQIFYRPLWRELSLRGHQVTVLTTDPMNDKTLVNLTEIDLHDAYKIWRMTEIAEEFKYNPYKILTEVVYMMDKIIQLELEHPEVRKLIEDKNGYFDLLIVEYLMPDMIAFSYRFQCPYIGITSLDADPSSHNILGNPAHPVLYPDFQLPMIPPLTFAERMISVFFYHLSSFFGEYYASATTEKNIKTYFGDDYPSISELRQNISMLFTNTNPAFETVRPLMPNTIPIGGGTHINPLKPLPKDLKTFLDSAKEGVIYLSLGSNVKSKHISEKLRIVIVDTFKNLPHKVLWKFEENITDKPDNVKIVKWCPQQDVLRHPNLKLFITQGGLQSIEESIMSHVPLIGMPFFMDQQRNAKKIVQQGLGLALDKDALTKEELTNTINEVINNPKYKKRVSELAELALDQPMSGIEKAVWWTEYILRHKGAKHLRSPKIPAYQYYLLDVVLFFVIVIFALVFFLYTVIKFIVTKICFMKSFKLKEL